MANGLKTRMKSFFKFIHILGGAAQGLFTTFATLTTGGSNQSNAEDMSEGAFRGGVLNYRIGKLDDGTDPYGWYEEE